MIRRARLADAEASAAVFTASFASMRFVPKLHSAEEDRAFVRGLIAEKEVWLAKSGGAVRGLACWHDDARLRGALHARSTFRRHVPKGHRRKHA